MKDSIPTGPSHTIKHCVSMGCPGYSYDYHPLCDMCRKEKLLNTNPAKDKSSLASLYPKYHKSTEGMDSVDVYAVHKLFNIQDPSGCIQHASKKLLLSGVRTGGKTKYDDIKEARDTLTRWLELNSPT